MIKFLNKTVFNSGCDGIVNTVNCIGVMGAGIALEFALRYPKMAIQYQDDCKEKKVKIGQILTYPEEDVLIINFPTKFHWKYPSQLNWIARGLDYLRDHYIEWRIKSIAVPPLGCSNGGLDFNDVKELIVDKLKDIDLDVYICIDPGYPEGKELQMVEAFNQTDKQALCDQLVIKGKARLALIESKTIDRFFKIKELENVGITTYEKLFNYFYEIK